MARTDHSNAPRHASKRQNLERVNRARTRQELSLGHFDGMPTRLATREMRTRVAL